MSLLVSSPLHRVAVKPKNEFEPPLSWLLGALEGATSFLLQLLGAALLPVTSALALSLTLVFFSLFSLCSSPQSFTYSYRHSCFNSDPILMQIHINQCVSFYETTVCNLSKAEGGKKQRLLLVLSPTTQFNMSQQKKDLLAACWNSNLISLSLILWWILYKRSQISFIFGSNYHVVLCKSIFI